MHTQYSLKAKNLEQRYLNKHEQNKVLLQKLSASVHIFPYLMYSEYDILRPSGRLHIVYIS